MAVCVPLASTHVTRTWSPGLWTCRAGPREVADVIRVSSIAVITDPCPIPALAAGVPGTACTTSAPEEMLSPS